MVELIVVVAVLGILAGLFVPRIMSWDRGKGEANAESIATLLSTAAQRAMYSTQELAVSFDATAGRMVLMARRPSDARNFDDAGTWEIDPLTPAAELEGLKVDVVNVGGLPQDSRRFVAVVKSDVAAGGRVPISMMVTEERTGRSWVIRLPATSDRAIVTESKDASLVQVVEPEAVDLDAQGRREDPW